MMKTSIFFFLTQSALMLFAFSQYNSQCREVRQLTTTKRSCLSQSHATLNFDSSHENDGLSHLLHLLLDSELLVEHTPYHYRTENASMHQSLRSLCGLGDVVNYLKSLQVDDSSSSSRQHMIPHGENWRLIKRVWNDGEWWSSSLNVNQLPMQVVLGLVQRQGYSIVIDRAQEFHATLRLWTDALETLFGHRVNANLYVTPSGGANQAFDAHFDWMDGIIVQTSGCKTWNVGKERIMVDPLPDSVFKIQGSEENSLLYNVSAIQLRVGSILYMPRGWAHEAATNCSTSLKSAEEEVSIHITFGLEAAVDSSVEIFLHHYIGVLFADDSEYGKHTSVVFTPSHMLSVTVSGMSMLDWLHLLLHVAACRDHADGFDGAALRSSVPMTFFAENLRANHSPMRSESGLASMVPGVAACLRSFLAVFSPTSAAVEAILLLLRMDVPVVVVEEEEARPSFDGELNDADGPGQLNGSLRETAVLGHAFTCGDKHERHLDAEPDAEAGRCVVQDSDNSGSESRVSGSPWASGVRAADRSMGLDPASRAPLYLMRFLSSGAAVHVTTRTESVPNEEIKDSTKKETMAGMGKAAMTPKSSAERPARRPPHKSADTESIILRLRRALLSTVLPSSLSSFSDCDGNGAINTEADVLGTQLASMLQHVVSSLDLDPADLKLGGEDVGKEGEQAHAGADNPQPQGKAGDDPFCRAWDEMHAEVEKRQRARAQGG